LASDAVRLAPRNPDTLYWRGIALNRSGSTEQAIAHWKEALRCDPDHHLAKTAWNKLKALEAKKEEGNNFFKQGQYAEAVVCYTEAIELDPFNEGVRNLLLSNRAVAFLKLNEFDRSIEDCDACLELQPRHVKALRTRAKVHLARNEYETAIHNFEEAYQAAPKGSAMEAELQKELKSAKIDLKRSKEKDHYKTLGVHKEASESEIKKAYRRESLLHHPDKGGDEAKFKDLVEAYAIIGDSEKRARYDRGEDESMGGMPDFGGMGSMPFPFFFTTSGGGASFSFSDDFGGSPFGHSHESPFSTFGDGFPSSARSRQGHR